MSLKQDNPQTTNPAPLINSAWREIKELKDAIRLYLHEYDNPMQDLTMRRSRLNKLRELVRENV